jgi:hypothetical protein
MRLTRKSFIISVTVLGSLALRPLAAQAQETATSKKPPAGYVRVWHFAPSIKTKISVSLAGPGSPAILGRAMVPSNLLNYREVPPGQYKLSVRTSADDLSVSEKNPEVLPPVSITVLDKSFQTIILQDDAGRPKILVANDSVIGTNVPKGAKRLRIFDFASGFDAALKSSPSNEVISAHVPAGFSEHIFPGNPGAMMLVMSNKLRNGHEAEQPVETNFNSVDSISALIMLDPYGRLSLRVFDDAKAD